MNWKIVLMIGILIMSGLNCNAQKQANKRKGNRQDEVHVMNREDVRQRAISINRPRYEEELRILTNADTLFLIDRKYVNAGDNATYAIPLTPEEKKIVIEGYSRGTFDVEDFNLYDENGELQFSSTGLVAHGEPRAPGPHYAYLWVAKGKEAFSVSYVNGIFNFRSTIYTITLSSEWRAKVDAILKKYCPDSFSKDEKYWDNL